MRQRGFGIPIELLAAGVVIALASGAFAYYNHVVAERARLELELSESIKAQQEQEAVNKDLREEAKRRDKLLAARELDRQKANVERGKLNAELEELKRQQPEVAAWTDRPVPAAVLERLRRPADRAADQGREAVPAGQPGGADRRAAPPR